MFMLFLAAATDPLPACAAAVHAMEPAAITAACPAPPRRNLWTDDYSPACDDALAYGRGLAKSAGLPAVMFKGLVGEFDKRAAACAHPEPPKPLPPKDCSKAARLWC